MCTRGCELTLTFSFHILSCITCKLIWSAVSLCVWGGGGGEAGIQKYLTFFF